MLNQGIGPFRIKQIWFDLIWANMCRIFFFNTNNTNINWINLLFLKIGWKIAIETILIFRTLFEI